MTNRTKLRLLAASATAALLAPIPLGHALANTTPVRPSPTEGPYVGSVKAGGDCAEEQAKAKAWGTHDGLKYTCRKVKPNCWLWKYDGPITGEWTGGPAKCKTCTPKPSSSASATPKPTPSTSASPTPSTQPSQSASVAASPSGSTHTTPAAGILPITGVPWGPVAFLGAVLVGLGITIRAVARRKF